MNIEEVNKINNNDFIQISEIILKSNSNTLAAKLSKKSLINFFLKVCAVLIRKKLIIFKENNHNIFYCIIAKKQKYL
jgi:hypothetical protein